MTAAKTRRLLSLDALRGWIMVLLALEAAGLYEHLEPVTEGSVWHPLIEQFFHHPWNGLHPARVHVHCRCSHGLFHKKTTG